MHSEDFTEDFKFNELNPVLRLAIIILGVGIAIPMVITVLSIVGVLMVIGFTLFALLMIYATYVDYSRVKVKSGE